MQYVPDIPRYESMLISQAWDRQTQVEEKEPQHHHKVLSEPSDSNFNLHVSDCMEQWSSLPPSHTERGEYGHSGSTALRLHLGCLPAVA